MRCNDEINRRRRNDINIVYYYCLFFNVEFRSTRHCTVCAYIIYVYACVYYINRGARVSSLAATAVAHHHLITCAIVTDNNMYGITHYKLKLLPNDSVRKKSCTLLHVLRAAKRNLPKITCLWGKMDFIHLKKNSGPKA